eukprot:CAMPEP_0184369872 /NCGR_PEP_ID=MMETSP1089-20130417/162493_1 /TAXON_ID=38269 ORGANISM="Gloeochaete wittrockiana, Strain SAG46.84" /NCGR_SAMPLE_ID=MMETSP1089 /ASSEMBLY_ACC=CAM_ASM_000445 /LENGTH=195 /DNA_ID=CAMNT_0026712381 /DNA_START=128 /DNA_END=716 /DNA_ORIENTATION=-
MRLTVGPTWEKTPANLYHERVLDHYNNPRNVGSLNKNDSDVGTGLVGAPACGDVLKLQIKVENGKVVDARFKTFGCGSAIASSSLVTELLVGKSIDEAMQIKDKEIAKHRPSLPSVTELLVGKSIDEAMQIKDKEIAKHLSLPPVKLHCSMLAEDAVKAAIKDYQTKQEKKKSILASSVVEATPSPLSPSLNVSV